MDADGPSPVRLQGLEVTQRLGLLQDAKAERFAWNGCVLGVGSSNLDEDTVVGATFVQLPSRMQETWAVTYRCGNL